MGLREDVSRERGDNTKYKLVTPLSKGSKGGVLRKAWGVSKASFLGPAGLFEKKVCGQESQVKSMRGESFKRQRRTLSA